MERLTNPDQIKKLEQSDLLDRLAEYTTSFTQLLFQKKRNEDYHHAKQMIKLISAEIESRKKPK